MEDRTCIAVEYGTLCGYPAPCLDLCDKHYSRWRRHGTTTLPPSKNWQTFLDGIATETDNCVLWPHHLNRKGYGVVSDPSTGKLSYICVLACAHKHGPKPSPAHQAAHGPCHTPSCFNPRHLSWKTPKENAADRKRDGTQITGTAAVIASQATVDADQVRCIRELSFSGLSAQVIADVYGISRYVVWDIMNGRTWWHV